MFQFEDVPAVLLQLLNELEESIHVVDENGKTVFYNQAASALDGLHMEEVLGVHILDVYPSLTKKTSTLVKVTKTGEYVDKHQQTYMNRKGNKVITVNKTFPLMYEGRLIGAVEVAERDIRFESETRELKNKITYRGKASLRATYQFEDIITQSKAMLREIDKGKRASDTHSPVLIVGETGTGKELMVQSIHSNSKRRNMPFIAQNCAAIPSSLFEGILFGTTKGAFTGAEDRSGLFELAHGGTLFLDEIQAMPIDVQAKLLRVLEEGVIRRVGGREEKGVDVRIIVAMNEDPLESLLKGHLRQDLFYRIHVVGIEIPPLRDRREDIPLLTDYFLETLVPKNTYTIAEDVMKMFESYHWPGNIRELKHTIEGAINISTSRKLMIEDLSSYFRSNHKGNVAVPACGLKEQLASFEQDIIQKALMDSGGNIKHAAAMLGIPRQTLQYKLKKGSGEGRERCQLN